MRLLWVLLVTLAKNVLARENVFYPSLPLKVTSSDNHQCQSDSDLLSDGIKNRKLWAMEVWDASAHGSSGILYGSTAQLGNFDECLNVQGPIKTQYCVVKLKAIVLNSNSPVWKFIQESTQDRSRLPLDEISYGICIPASCTRNDLEVNINRYLMNTTRSSEDDVLFSATIPELFCTTNEKEDFTIGEMLFILFCITITVSVVMGTILDYALPDTKTLRMFRCFSLKTNFRQLFEGAKSEEQNHPLAVLHGVKAVSIVGVLYGHRFGVLLALATFNYREVEVLRSKWVNVTVTQMDLIVDTFFFISGLLVAYFLVDVVAKKTANPLLVIFTRIIRIAPIYYFLIWLNATIFQRLGSGPFWNLVQGMEKNFCEENWWTNVLFLNNYINSNAICMIHSWYLACDMHFFVIALLLIIILVKKWSAGISIIIFLTICTSIVPGLVVYFYKLDPLVLFFNEFLENPRSSAVFDLLYTKSHNRVTVYLIGVMLGIFLNCKKDSKTKFSGGLSFCLSLLATSLLLVVMFVGSLYYTDREEKSIINSAIFSIVRRPLWAMGLGILMVVHRFGPKTFWSKLFTSRPAFVLSKLVYSVYLIHDLLITATMAKTRVPYPFGLFDTMVAGSGDLFTSYFYGCLLYLMLELPVKRILREVLFSCSLQLKPNKEPTEIVTIKL